MGRNSNNVSPMRQNLRLLETKRDMSAVKIYAHFRQSCDYVFRSFYGFLVRPLSGVVETKNRRTDLSLGSRWLGPHS